MVLIITRSLRSPCREPRRTCRIFQWDRPPHTLLAGHRPAAAAGRHGSSAVVSSLTPPHGSSSLAQALLPSGEELRPEEIEEEEAEAAGRPAGAGAWHAEWDLEGGRGRAPLALSFCR